MGLFEELQGIDINDMASWTRRVKLFFAALLCIAIIAAGYYFITVSYTHLTLPTIYSV